MAEIGVHIANTSMAHSEVIGELKEILGDTKISKVIVKNFEALGTEERNRATCDLSEKIDITEAESLILDISKLLEDLSEDKHIGGGYIKL